MSKSQLASVAVGGILLGLLGGGCANYAQLQSADTVPEGVARMGVGATFTKYTVEIDGQEDSVTVPALEGWVRYGATDQLEIHGNVWMPLGASIGAKYQLLGNRSQAGLALSLGLDVGALSISAGSGENETTQTVVDTYVPVYLGYRTGPDFALYVTPKYILRTTFGDGGSGVGHALGGTVGVAIGESTTFHIEGSAFYDTAVEAAILNGAIGVSF